MRVHDPLRQKSQYALVVLLLLAIWYLASRFGLLTSFFIPSIAEVAAAALRIRPTLPEQMVATGALVLCGYVLGAISAWGVGYLALSWSWIESLVSPIIDLLRGIPAICYVPFFILWFGFSSTGKIFLIQINVFLMLLPALVANFRALPPHHFEFWRSTGRSYRAFVLRDLLSSTVGVMLPTLRFALAFAVMMAVIAEAMGATIGLGHVMMVALSTFSLASVASASIAAAVIAAVLDLALILVVRLLAPWVRF